ncbi:MAG: hypothetical protein Q7R76_06980 [Candidatus Woesearchaeota archaeon]|nr:hypothetical protein [Candidatus Woesearchaeota archaeon]
MPTVSHLVKKIIAERPNLQEAILENIVSFANLAEHLQPRIERELGTGVQTQSIVMALRRHAEELNGRVSAPRSFRLVSEIIMKTNLCDITLVKTPSAVEKIRTLHSLIDVHKGETLNAIYGNYEVTLVLPQKHLDAAKKILKSEKILNTATNLVALTLSMTKDFFTTPGVLALATRKLAWENINICENISTMTELIFIIAEKDATRAYNVFQELMVEKN